MGNKTLKEGDTVLIQIKPLLSDPDFEAVTTACIEEINDGVCSFKGGSILRSVDEVRLWHTKEESEFQTKLCWFGLIALCLIAVCTPIVLWFK